MNKRQLAKKPGRKSLTIAGIILCVILIPILIANTTLIVKSFLSPSEVPSFFGYKPFIVLSDSMNPEVEAGDIAIIKEVDTGSLVVGDIIAFKEGDAVITHRIVEITDSSGTLQFTTRGDANTADDASPVSEEMVEGIYLFNIPELGNGAIFIQTPVGMMLFVALPLILFILYDIIRRRWFDRQKQQITRSLEEELEKIQKQLLSTDTKDTPETQNEEVKK